MSTLSAPGASGSPSLRSRIRAGVAILLLPLVLVIGVAELALSQEQSSVERVTSVALTAVLPLAQLEADVESAQRLGIDAASGDDSSQDTEAYREIVADVDEDFARLKRSGPMEHGDLDAAAAAWRRATHALETTLATTPRARSQDDPSLLAFVRPLRESLRALNRAIVAAEADLDTEIAAADRRRDLLAVPLLLVASASVAIVLLLRRRLTRSVVVPIAALQQSSRRFARGDLDHRIVPQRDDELGELAESLNAMAAELAAQRDALAESQQRLVEAQKLEAVGQIAGSIAHDFNNLLLVVGTYADFLRDSFEADDPRRDDAAEIRQASDRAAALTRQLLAFSRRDVSQPVPLDLAATIARLEPLLRHTLDAPIDLRLELDHDLGPTAIDAAQLEQVVLSLVLNSQNAMPDGGTLTLSARAASSEETLLADGLILGPSVAIAVADTGTGMIDDVRSRALEPFFTTRAGEGASGLGLPTVHEIVTRAGGGMTIASDPGKGTTVVLYLPTTTAGVGRPSVDEPQIREPGHGTVVLVAEDEPTIRDLTTRILSRQGYTILMAASGADALALARQTDQVDVLLTDVIMPGMTGNELAATLAEERPGLPIVYMSGYSDQMVAERGVLAAEARYLRKPFKPQELLELLAEATRIPV